MLACSIVTERRIGTGWMMVCPSLPPSLWLVDVIPRCAVLDVPARLGPPVSPAGGENAPNAPRPAVNSAGGRLPAARPSCERSSRYAPNALSCCCCACAYINAARWLAPASSGA